MWEMATKVQETKSGFIVINKLINILINAYLFNHLSYI